MLLRGIKKNVILLISVLTIGGCSTTPTAVSSAKLAPSERLIAFQNKISGPSGMLVITRDVGFMGGGCYNSISINGTLAARLGVGEKSTFVVPAGEALLRVGRDPEGTLLCGTGQNEWTQRETMIQPDETKYFRLSIDSAGKADIQRGEQ